MVDALQTLADVLWEAIQWVITSLFNDASYRAGFLTAIVTLLILGQLSQLVAWAWNLILTFFHHTPAPPAPGQGPTPAGVTGGCAWGSIILVFLTLLAAGLLYQLFTR